ncbi:S1C family serine protease [uncultured Jatrophihabitans sp.]|uniref:S1C family serine protease n=1 Tax=uncultured Jatrophihabitans sp. TaxID=1610747 RepID=UPI0035C9A57B
MTTNDPLGDAADQRPIDPDGSTQLYGPAGYGTDHGAAGYGSTQLYGPGGYGTAYGAAGYGSPYGTAGYGSPHGTAGYGSPYATAIYATSYGWAPPAAAPSRPRRRRRAALGVGAALVAAGLVAGGVAIGNDVASSGSLAGSGSVLPSINGSGGTGSGGTGSGGTGSGNGGLTPNGGIFPGGGTGAGGGTTSAAVATSAQQKGVVTVVSVLKYQSAESAGTGMILTSDGEVLTNNHVIAGATSVTVTVASTGKSYRASVVGTDPSDDIAVLQLTNASGLQTAKVGDSSDVATGDAITGVGNAGGTGTLRAAKGSVTALNQSITATDEDGQNAEKLTGLIGVDAGIISGDSGGPMYDASGEIIGMNTAASTATGQGGLGAGSGAGAGSAGETTAYAIPIDKALSVAAEIESGVQTSTVHIGLPGFIGVSVADSNGSGAAVTRLLDGGPAANAGISSGSVITGVGDKSVTSAASLKTALLGHKPGSSVRVTWTDAAGATHSATVTLATGPAD